MIVVSETMIQIHIIQIFGSLLSGTEQQTQYLLNYNIIPTLSSLLDHSNENIRQNTCWTISNITAGTTEQIQLIMNEETNIIIKLHNILINNESIIKIKTKIDIFYIFGNIFSEGTIEQLLYLININNFQIILLHFKYLIINTNNKNNKEIKNLEYIIICSIECILRKVHLYNQKLFDEIVTFIQNMKDGFDIIPSMLKGIIDHLQNEELNDSATKAQEIMKIIYPD